MADSPPARLSLEPFGDRRLPTTVPTHPPVVPLDRTFPVPRMYAAAVAIAYPTLAGHQVRLYQGQGTYREFTAYPGRPDVSDCVTVAVADVTGDGVADVITGVVDLYYSAAAAPVELFDGAAILALPANPAAPSALTPR